MRRKKISKVKNMSEEKKIEQMREQLQIMQPEQINKMFYTLSYKIISGNACDDEISLFFEVARLVL